MNEQVRSGGPASRVLPRRNMWEHYGLQLSLLKGCAQRCVSHFRYQ